MAPYKFTKLINEGGVIQRYGDGTSKRDYTYIDDIVDGIVKVIEKDFEYEIINLGNNKLVELNYFIGLIEKLLNKKAVIENLPMQPGDVDVTYAEISKAQKLLGYNPTTSIEDGMGKFVKWYLAS